MELGSSFWEMALPGLIPNPGPLVFEALVSQSADLIHSHDIIKLILVGSTFRKPCTCCLKAECCVIQSLTEENCRILEMKQYVYVLNKHLWFLKNKQLWWGTLAQTHIWHNILLVRLTLTVTMMDNLHCFTLATSQHCGDAAAVC